MLILLRLDLFDLWTFIKMNVQHSVQPRSVGFFFHFYLFLFLPSCLSFCSFFVFRLKLKINKFIFRIEDYKKEFRIFFSFFLILLIILWPFRLILLTLCGGPDPPGSNTNRLKLLKHKTFSTFSMFCIEVKNLKVEFLCFYFWIFHDLKHVCCPAPLI